MGTWGPHPMASDFALDIRDEFFDEVVKVFEKEEDITADWLINYAKSCESGGYVIAYIYLDCMKAWPKDEKMLRVIKNCLNLNSLDQEEVDTEYFYKDNGFRYPNGKTYDVIYRRHEFPMDRFYTEPKVNAVIDEFIADKLTQQEFVVKLYRALEEAVGEVDIFEKDFNVILDNIDLFFQTKDQRHKEYLLTFLDDLLDAYNDVVDEYCLADSYEEDEGHELSDFYKYLREFYYHFDEVVAGTYKLAADPGLFAKMLNGKEADKIKTEVYPKKIIYIGDDDEEFFYNCNLESTWIKPYRERHIEKDFIDVEMADIYTADELLRQKAEMLARAYIKLELTKNTYDVEFEKQYRALVREQNKKNKNKKKA